MVLETAAQAVPPPAAQAWPAVCDDMLVDAFCHSAADIPLRPICR
jgi:hypothetical protein